MTTLTRADSDRVRPLTRAVSYLIIPFLLLAFSVLYPFPGDTGRIFAWEIKPTITAMVLGSAYLGGAYFFLRAARAGAWHTVKAGFPAVGLFATLMGAATVIHWDKFQHGRLSFWMWAGVYFTTPFLIGWVWLRNHGYDAPAEPDDLLLPVPTARLFGAAGGLALAMGLFLFALPRAAASIWPWALTPLTARVLGAVFCLGAAGLGALVDRRWSSARIAVQVAVVMLALIVVAGLRARTQLAPGNALTWVFAVGFGGLTVALVAYYQRMETRARR